MATYSTDKEHTNYARLCRALIDLCTETLRDILQGQIHLHDIKTKVRRCRDLGSAGLKSNQKAIINNAATVGSYKEFDITLLCQVLRLLSVQELRDALNTQINPSQINTAVQNCPALISDPRTSLSPAEINDVKYAASNGSYDHCKDELLWKLYKHLCPTPIPNITHPTNLWSDNTLPDPSHTMLGDDIQRIRVLRNSLYGHIANTKITDTEFSVQWQVLENIMVRMDRLLGKRYKDELDQIKVTCMDDVTEKKYCDEIEKIAANEKELQEKVSGIQSTVTQLEVRVSEGESRLQATITQSTEEAGSRITQIEKDMDEMEANLKDVRKEKSGLKSGIKSIEERTWADIERHRQDKTFVVTQAVVKGTEVLNEHGMLIYSGLPGSGKTKNAIELLAQFKETHPDWSFIKLDDVRKWPDIPLHVHLLILLDDCLGNTNTDNGLIIDGKQYWSNIYSCVKTGKIKVILTIRKNILLKNCTELEKYELFFGEHTVDLTSKEFILSKDIKKEVLLRHCKNNNIHISSELSEENYKSIDLFDKNYQVKLSEYTVGKIIETHPVIGFPFSCYLFCCHRKYTKLGPEFFKKPSKILVDEINNLIKPESKQSEKVQYCIMAYMMLNGGKVDINNLDLEMFEQVDESLALRPTKREKDNALDQLSHRYIVEVGDNQTFEFKHQTILESVALCFYVDNAELLLKLCSKKFITEFIRPQSYKVSEGEVVLTLKQNDYKYLLERFIYSLLRDKGYSRFLWWVIHPVLDDVQFVVCLMDVIQSNQLYKQAIQECCNIRMLKFVASRGNTYLIDRLYNVVAKDISYYKNCLMSAARSGRTNTVKWLLDHKIGLDNVIMELCDAPTDTLTSVINHPNITPIHVIGILDDISAKVDKKTVEAVCNRWTDIDQTYVLRLLCDLCMYGNHKPIDVIIKKRPDVLTQQNMTEAFSWACVGGHIDTVEYLLNIKHTSISCKILHISQNDENLTNLHIAAFFGRLKVFKKLMELGLCVGDITKSDLSVLNLATLGYAFQDMYEPDFDDDDNEYWYRVINIIKIKSVLLAQYLKHIKIFGILSDYRQVLSNLVDHRVVDLTDTGMEIDEHGSTLSHYCVIHNDVPMIEHLYSSYRKSVYSPNGDNMTCVHIAAFLGRFDMMKKLIELGLSITNRTKSNLSVLNLAILGYACQGLSEHKVSDIIQSKSAVLAHYCTQESIFRLFGTLSDYRQIFTYLLHHKDMDLADIDMEIDEHGSTLSHYCVKYNDVSMIELLYKTCRNHVYSTNSANMTYVHIAAFLGRFDIMNKLIELGLSVTDRTESCLSVLNLAILGYACHGMIKHGCKHMLPYFTDSERAVLAQCCTRRENSSVLLSNYRQILSNLLDHKDTDMTDIDMEIDECFSTLTHYCAIHSDLPMIDLLYTTCRKSVYSKDIDDMTCVHIAAFLGRFDMINKMIELGLSITDRTESGLSVLNLAILGYACHGIDGHNVPDIIKSKSFVLAQYWTQREKSLGQLSDHRQVLSKLLDHTDIDGTDIDMEIDEHGNTLSHYCVIHNDVQMIELLYNTFRKSVYFKNSDNMTCVHIAAFLGRFDIMNKLIEMGFCVTDRTKSGLSVLNLAILGYACKGMYKDTYENKIPYHIKIHSAVLAHYIRRRCSHLYGSSYDFRQLLSYLLHHEGMDLAELDMKIDEYDNTLSHYCVIYNDVPIIELLYNTYRKSVYSTNIENMTCVHIAAFLGRLHLIYELIELGVCITDRTKSGLSVLNLAILGYIFQGMYKHIFEHKVPDIIKSKSIVLARYCAERGNSFGPFSNYKEMLSKLLNHKDIDMTDIYMQIDEYGSTLSHYCVIYNDIPMIDLLYKTCKKSVNSENSENMTCVHVAALLGRFDVMNKLIGTGINVTDRTKSGLSVLKLAIQGYACQHMGFDKKSNIMSKSALLALHYRQMGYRTFTKTLSDYRQVFSFLLQHGNIDLTDIDMETDEHGSTLSHYCGIYNDVPMIELLYKTCKKSVYSTNRDNMTCLHIAAFLGRFETMNKLIELGLSVTDRTKSGLSLIRLTILGYAYMSGANASEVIKSESSVLAHYNKQTGWRLSMGNLSDYTQMLRYLLELKDVVIEDLDITVNDCTLGHYCVVYNHPSIMELLCKVCPSILSVQNNNRHKPIDLAVLMGRSQIFKTLYFKNIKHDTLRDNLKSLISRGRQYAGQKYGFSTKPDFLSFLSIYRVPFDMDIYFGDGREYTSIQLEMDTHDDV